MGVGKLIPIVDLLVQRQKVLCHPLISPFVRFSTVGASRDWGSGRHRSADCEPPIGFRARRCRQNSLPGRPETAWACPFQNHVRRMVEGGHPTNDQEGSGGGNRAHPTGGRCLEWAMIAPCSPRPGCFAPASPVPHAASWRSLAPGTPAVAKPGRKDAYPGSRPIDHAANAIATPGRGASDGRTLREKCWTWARWSVGEKSA